MRAVLTLLAVSLSVPAAVSLATRRADAQSHDAGLPETPPDPMPDNPDEPTEQADAGAAPGAAAVSVQRLIADAAAPVASGRGVSVTAGEVYQRVEDEPEPTQRDMASHPGLVDALVDRMVADRLMANEARRLGLENDPYVRAAVERALIARLRATVINPGAGSAADITDEQIRAWYDAHPDRFHTPARRNARVIFFTNRREADRVMRLARQRRNAPDFRDLVRQYNTDPDLLRRNGEIRDLRPDDATIDPALRRAIYAVRASGQLFARPVPGAWHGTHGFFLVMLTGARPAVTRTLEEASSWIRLRLLLERRVRQEREMVTRLSNQAGVTRLPAAQVVRVTAGGATPAGSSGSVDAGQP